MSAGKRYKKLVERVKENYGKINVEICSNCHPYFTGKQNLVDTAGRIEKYMEKYNLTESDLKQ